MAPMMGAVICIAGESTAASCSHHCTPVAATLNPVQASR